MITYTVYKVYVNILVKFIAMYAYQFIVCRIIGYYHHHGTSALGRPPQYPALDLVLLSSASFRMLSRHCLHGLPLPQFDSNFALQILFSIRRSCICST